jgi:hypothetical protein
VGLFRKAAAPPSDPVALAAWMRREFEAGHHQAVWEHRLHLGYEFGQQDLGDRDWFWLNAYPALAALRIGVKADSSSPFSGQHHPFVATCAGYADQVHRGLGEDAARANAEISERFFG